MKNIRISRLLGLTTLILISGNTFAASLRSAEDGMLDLSEFACRHADYRTGGWFRCSRSTGFH